MKIGIHYPCYSKDADGGIEKLIRKLHAHLKKKGHDVEIITLNLNPYSSWQHDCSVFSQSLNLLNSVRIYLKRFDVIHSHSPLLALPLLPCSRVVLTYHTYERKDTAKMNALRRFIHKRVLDLLAFNSRHACRVIAVSDHVKRNVQHDARINDVEVIKNGVDLDYIEGNIRKNPFADGVNVVAIGRISREKGFDLLIEAAKNVRAHFHIFGPFSDRKYAKELQKLIEKSKLKNVKLHGKIDEKEKYEHMRYADVFVMPSREEGLSFAAIEAVASSAAVVSSDIAPLKEVFGESALYFSKENAEDLADQINKMIKDRKLRERLREKIKERKKLFRIEKVLDRHLAIYEELSSGP